MMWDPYDPYGPFDDASPMYDPWGPLEDVLAPFREVFPTSPMPFDPVPDPFFPHDPLADVPDRLGPGDFIDPGYLAFDSFPGPENPVDPMATPWGISGPQESPLQGSDILDLVEDSAISASTIGIVQHDIEDLLEHSIERGDLEADPMESNPSGGIGKESLAGLLAGPDQNKDVPVAQESKPLYGVRTPDPKIDLSSKPVYERKLPIPQWRPRRSLGLRGTFSSKSGSRSVQKKEEQSQNERSRVRECPAQNEMVSLAECESCEHFKDEQCMWRHNEEEQKTEQDLEDLE